MPGTSHSESPGFGLTIVLLQLEKPILQRMDLVGNVILEESGTILHQDR